MAIPPVVIEFIAKGVPDIARATRSVADAVARGDRVVTDTTNSGERLRQRLVESSAKEKIRAYQAADRAVASAQRAGLREAESAARAEVRMLQSTATERIRIAQRVAQEERRLQMEIARGAGAPATTVAARKRLDVLQSAKHGSTDDQKKALDHVGALRVADTAAASELRAEEHLGQQKLAIRERYAEKQARLEMQQEAKVFEQRKKYALAMVGGGAQAAKTAYHGGIALARTGLNLGGGFDIQDALQSRMHLRGELADISNRGIVTAEQAGGSTENVKRRSVDELQGAVTGVSKQWAIDPEKASAGLDKFASKTGNLNRGMELLSGLAEMSRAGAGDLDNLADAAGDVFNADTTQNANQVLAVMRALAAQGKIGAVEMKDLATQMSALGAAAGRFQGDAGKNMAMMGGLAQLSRASGGSKSAAQATTAVTSLTNQLYKNKRIEGFQNLGVNVKDEKTGLNRDLDAILMETLQGAEKKSRASGHGMRDFDVNFGGAVSDAQARRATIPLEKAYKEAGGGEAGTKAARALLDKFAGANSSKEDVSAAAAERMKEADVQFERVVLELRDVAARELLPALRDAAPAFAKMVPVVGDVLHELVALVNWAESNPMAAAFAGLGVFITKSIGEEVGKAALAKTLESSLATRLGGAAGLTVAAATIAIAAGMIAIDKLASDEQKSQNTDVKTDVDATNALTDLNHGVAAGAPTKAQVDKANNAKGFLQARIKEKEATIGGSDVAYYGASALAALEDGAYNLPKYLAGGGYESAQQDVDQSRVDRQTADQAVIVSLKDDLAKLTTALDKNTSATKENSTATGDAPSNQSGPTVTRTTSMAGRSSAASGDVQ